MVVYDLQNSRDEQFGVLASSGAHKPSFADLAQALASPFGRVRNVTVAPRRRGRAVLASGSGSVGDYMQLQAFAGGALRYRALFTMDRFNRYSILLPAVLGTHGLAVRVFQYWSGLGRAAQAQI